MSAAVQAAQDAALGVLLACHLREDPRWEIRPVADLDAATARLAGPRDSHVASRTIPGTSAAVVVGVCHHSPARHHRVTLPARIVTPGQAPVTPGAAALGALLVDVLAADHVVPDGAAALLTERFLSSMRTIEEALAARAHDVARLWSAAPLGFLDTEQGLLLGHPLHPTPKSRVEMSPGERMRYGPEVGARFGLRWFAVDPDLVVHDSAAGAPAPRLVRELLEADPGLERAAFQQALAGPRPRVLIPVHPWEADFLAGTPGPAADLLAAGRLVDLGVLGPAVAPTSSVRTVYRAEWDWQLKLSLHVRVTNSLRVTLPKELVRAVEAARLAATPVGRLARRVAPHLTVVHDPAYLAVRHEGAAVPGLEVLLRANRWRAGDATDVTAVATLCQPRPDGGPSRLAAIITARAARDGRRPAEAAREWYARYLEVMVVSLVRLYTEVGLTYEPHAQNTLLELADGLPQRAIVRDSQGYFHRELAHDDLCAVMPRLGEDSESIFGEALADERLVYYPFVNNAVGVANAIAGDGLIDEAVLLGDLRAVAERERRRPARYPATLLDHLLDDARWPCKANLLTRLHDMDELVGDIAEQSVYITMPNPLAGAPAPA